MVSVKVKNIKNVENAIKKYGDDAVNAFEETVVDTATKIAEIAKQRAPINNGTLQNSIHWEMESKLTYNVGTNQPYAPYIEFGTGAKVQVPAEFADMANRAKGKGGSFKDGLAAIKEWCRKKGIDEKAAYPIFVSILNNGIEPKPFMYPAYLQGKAMFPKKIKEAIKYLNKKFNG